MKGPPARHDEPKEVFPAVEGIISDAGELSRGDRVVYPNQGVCRITGIEVKEIAGQRLELVRMEREEDGAAVLVPRGKVPAVGLRRVASADQIEGVFHFLAAQFEDPELDWKVRHRDNADRLIAGGVLGVAEVVKGLHSLSRIRPLPTKEREQYDNARHLLVHEIAVSLAVPPALAEDYIDFALMPPEGVVFELKPPPKPVQLPVRPRRRIVRPADEEDDLGLESLGIDLGTGDVELPGAELDVPLPTGDAIEGAAPEEGAEELPLPAEGEGDEAAEDEEAPPLPAVSAKLRPATKAAPLPKHSEKKPAAHAAPAKAPKDESAAAAKRKPEKPPAKAAEKPRPVEKKKPPAAKKPEKAPAKAAPRSAAKAAKGAPAKATKAAPAKKPVKPKAPAAKKAEKPAKKAARGGSKK